MRFSALVNEVTRLDNQREMRRAFPIILALLGMLLVAGSAGSALLGSAVDNPAGLPLPDRIARLDRGSYVTGREAAAEFRQLHGEQFPVIAGAVGMSAGSPTPLAP